MANNKFSVYGQYKTVLETGNKITAQREIYAYGDKLQEEIKEYLLENINEENRKEIENKLKEEEQRVFNEMQKKLDEWQEIAQKLATIRLAKEYEKECAVLENKQTTDNEWTSNDNYGNHLLTISNNVYSMYIRVYERTKYIDGESKPIAWDVTYSLYYNAKETKIITKIDNKKFTDKDKAYKYVEGRQKAFSSYFKEMYPAIPNEDARYFSCNGKLLKGYKLQD